VNDEGKGMNTEEGVVLKTEANTAWVKTIRTGSCSECSAREACHSIGGGKEMEVHALNPAGARTGDRVVIGFETGSLLKASFLLYIIPIFALIAGAALGEGIAGSYVPEGSAAPVIGGISFLVLSLLFVRRVGNRMALKDTYRAKVIRILSRVGTERCEACS